MTSFSRKSAVVSILSSIFQIYKKQGFNFLLIENTSGTEKDNLLIVNTEELAHFKEREKDWRVVRSIEQFEDVPKDCYSIIVDQLGCDLGYITN